MGSADRVTRIEARLNLLSALNLSYFDESPSEIMAATREILPTWDYSNARRKVKALSFCHLGDC
jgi:hypothetical protein